MPPRYFSDRTLMNMNLDCNKKSVIVKEYSVDGGVIQVFENYLVTIFDEGTTLKLEQVYQLIGISEIHFRDLNFGIISYRKNSIAIDPTTYTYLRSIENLRAFAIVSRREIDMHNYGVEKMFFKKNMQYFIELDNAVAWVKRCLKTVKPKNLKGF